jgi:hypothetical protein
MTARQRWSAGRWPEFQAHSGWAVTFMVPVPPSATTLGGPATVSWHFGGVGPVVTSDVVFESHPAMISATVAIRPGRTEGYRRQGVANSEVHRGARLKDIKVSQHPLFSSGTAALSDLCIPCASDLSRCSLLLQPVHRCLSDVTLVEVFSKRQAGTLQARLSRVLFTHACTERGRSNAAVARRTTYAWVRVQLVRLQSQVNGREG